MAQTYEGTEDTKKKWAGASGKYVVYMQQLVEDLRQLMPEIEAMHVLYFVLIAIPRAMTDTAMSVGQSMRKWRPIIKNRANASKPSR